MKMNGVTLISHGSYPVNLHGDERWRTVYEHPTEKTPAGYGKCFVKFADGTFEEVYHKSVGYSTTRNGDDIFFSLPTTVQERLRKYGEKYQRYMKKAEDDNYYDCMLTRKSGEIDGYVESLIDMGVVAKYEFAELTCYVARLGIKEVR